MKHYLRAGDVFVDVGANEGLYSVFARSLVGESGQVHAYEASSSVYGKLVEVISLNQLDNVNAYELALGEKSGSREFFENGDGCTGHMVPVSEMMPVSQAATVTTVRLDEHLRDNRCDLIKLDIEGYEPFALRGAEKILTSLSPALIIEVAGYSNRFGVSTPQFIEQLKAFGYSVYVYQSSDRRLVPTNEPWTMGVENVIALPNKRLSKIEDRLEGSAAEC